MSDMELNKIESKEIWVDLFEAAELTGFNLESMRKLAYRIAQQAEDERPIKIRKRTSRWEMWLPDLVAYTKLPLRGPRPKREK
jgi:hypothetical protein